MSKSDVTSKPDAAKGSNDMIDMVGGRLELVGRMGAGESDTVLVRTRIRSGEGVPLHSHTDPECFYVLTGRLDVFLVDDAMRWHAVEAGRSLLVADGIRHAVRNPAEEDADVVVLTNNRFARFLREAGRPVKPGTAFVPPAPDDFVRLRRAADAYGYWLSSPEEHAAITG